MVTARLEGLEFRDETSLVASAVRLGTSLPGREIDPSRAPIFDAATRLRGLGALKVVPLKAGSQVLGTLVVGDEDGHTFSTLDHSFLNAVANQAALAIGNSRLLESQRKQRVSAEVRETELRSQQRSLNLLNNITQSALKSPGLVSTLNVLIQELGELAW